MKLLIIGLLAALTNGFTALFRKPSGSVRLANIAEGVHGDGQLTKLTDAAITGRFRVVKFGSDAAHVAVAAGTDAGVLGICSDEATAAEAPVNVRLFGQVSGTLRCLLAGTVAAGDELSTTTGGAVFKLPTATGTYYPIGRALVAGVSGDTIEFMHRMPVPRVVP